MTPVIVHEVTLFISRNGAKNSHIYYAVAYLNRLASSVAPKDEKVRVMLLRIYFSLFKKILNTDFNGEEVPEVHVKKDRTKSKRENQNSAKKPVHQTKDLDQEDNKVAELVLKGVNILMSKCSDQLFDSMGGESSSAEMRRLIEEETMSIFRLAHSEVFRIAIQALKLLFQFAKQQKKMKRTRGEIEIALEGKEKEGDTLADRYYRALYEILLRVHLNKAAKMDEFFSLLFKSIKADPEHERVLAFVRRLIQMSTLNEPSYTAACLLIISELIRCKDDLRFQLYSLEQISSQRRPQNKKGKAAVDEDDDEERFYDVDKEEEDLPQVVEENKPETKARGSYDPLKREPKYAQAESTPIYELVHLTFHMHPTVKLWATNLVQG